MYFSWFLRPDEWPAKFIHRLTSRAKFFVVAMQVMAIIMTANLIVAMIYGSLYCDTNKAITADAKAILLTISAIPVLSLIVIAVGIFLIQLKGLLSESREAPMLLRLVVLPTVAFYISWAVGFLTCAIGLLCLPSGEFEGDFALRNAILFALFGLAAAMIARLYSFMQIR
ncbi:MAG: hypothetical protein KGL18_05500 [Burkholderiales bacterium]|nr:hypothetical protein [Burkholderiales bacterium]MDE1928723.1 hypothetical protein [Burkholderiales bacterium]MDE2502416.1 hypothetical protein [Burkholderiales bacterium]